MASKQSPLPTVLSLFGLTPLRIGGTERYCLELSRALRNCGWQSILAFEGQPHAVVREYLAQPGVTIEDVPSLTAGGLRTLVRVRNLMRQYRPQVVHLHYTGFVTPFPWLARICGASKVYLTSHTSYPESHQPMQMAVLKRAIYRVVNAPISGVICPSDFGRGCLVATGILDPRCYQVIYNATHVPDLTNSAALARRFRLRYRIPDDRVLVVQVGQLTREKGVYDLLAAFHLAFQQRPNLHLALVGDGPDRKNIEHTIAELGLSERVTLTGLLADPEEAGVFSACDIACLVSRWQELFGFVLIEAMARAKPIVATRVGGISEIVTSGETGLLAARGDVATIAAHLVSLSESENQRRKLGEAARARVQSHFEVVKMVGEVLDYYGISPPRPGTDCSAA